MKPESRSPTPGTSSNIATLMELATNTDLSDSDTEEHILHDIVNLPKHIKSAPKSKSNTGDQRRSTRGKNTGTHDLPSKTHTVVQYTHSTLLEPMPNQGRLNP